MTQLKRVTIKTWVAVLIRKDKVCAETHVMYRRTGKQLELFIPQRMRAAQINPQSPHRGWQMNWIIRRERQTILS